MYNSIIQQDKAGGLVLKINMGFIVRPCRKKIKEKKGRKERERKKTKNRPINQQTCKTFCNIPRAIHVRKITISIPLFYR